MEYNGTVYRPPLEAWTYLLPVTEGCTHNSCAFCNMFRDIPFRMLPLEALEAHLEETEQSMGGACGRIDRVYFVGGDPFALSAGHLLKRVELVRRHLPNAVTFTMYARTNNVASKNEADLKALAEAGVNDLYLGVESGLDDVLLRLDKGYTTEETKVQCLRLADAGIRHCDLIMFGTAGKGRGGECAEATAMLENETKPSRILATTMTAFVGTKLDRDIISGAFHPASERENLEEEKTLVERLDLPECWFWAAHPLDSVSLSGRLGTDKVKMLDQLERGLAHVDEWGIDRTSRSGTL
ncbi:MAG: radical SAM protein [Desulfovibrio sp.]|nr:radical SAM protein [Desulfovibrio sp.]